MAVVPFAAFRFTPEDVSRFYRLALPKMRLGLWSALSRQSGANSDRLMVLAANRRPLFTLERNRQGLYRLWYHDADGMICLGSGETVGECLAVWEPRRSRRGRAGGDAV